MGLWKWIAGEKTSGDKVSSTHSPIMLEQLEPRLLLSASALDPQLINQTHDLSEGQVISVDINSSSESYLISESAVSSQDVQASENTDQSQPTPLAQAEIVPGGAGVGVQEQSDLANTNVIVNEVETYSSDSNGAMPEDEGDAPVNVDSVNLGQTGTESIWIRGPPQGESGVFDTVNAVCYNKAEELISQPEEVEPSSIPVLPGLELVDPDTSRWAGQVIYLDFDGAEDVVYNGPVTVGPFDVPAFQSPAELAGQEKVIISSVVSNLQQTFASTGIIFTTTQPEQGQAYSTIYIGADDSAFSQYGSFLGLAEKVDVSNRDACDCGFAFANRIQPAVQDVDSYAVGLAGIIGHEVGHLVGYAHLRRGLAGEGALASVANGTVTVEIDSCPSHVNPGNLVDIVVRIKFEGNTQQGPWQVESLRLYDSDPILDDKIAVVNNPFKIEQLGEWYYYTFENVDISKYDEGDHIVELCAWGEINDNEWNGFQPDDSSPIQSVLVGSAIRWESASGHELDEATRYAFGTTVYIAAYSEPNQALTVELYEDDGLFPDDLITSFQVTTESSGRGTEAWQIARTADEDGWDILPEYVLKLGEMESRVLQVRDDGNPGEHPNGVVIGGVPSYEWYYGCGPTAVGMAMGYWDANGFDNLIPGDASAMTQAVKDSIASNQHITAGQENRPVGQDDEKDKKYDGFGDWHNCPSFPQHESSPNCIADFLKTEDGGTSGDAFVPGVSGYLEFRGYTGWHTFEEVWLDFSWSDLTASIDACHPLVAGVDSDGNGHPDHATTIIGYDPSTYEYATLNTSRQSLKTTVWYDFAPVAGGNVFGIYGVWYFYPTSEIEVRGSDVAILDGDTTPDSADGTDFGSVNQGQGGKEIAFTINNVGGEDLTIGEVRLENNSGFEVTQQPASTVQSGESTTFTIRLLDAATGSKSADVVFGNNDSDENPFNFRITGIVTSPSAQFTVGDLVRVTSLVNARTGPGTGSPEIPDPDYPGEVPVGTVGTVTDGPQTDGTYTWWEVDYGNGSYKGWSIGGSLEHAIQSGRTMGIDVSSWQGSIDWQKVAESGHTFAFVRASWGYPENGEDYEDDCFDANMTSGRDAGLLMGAYHFAYPNLNPTLAGAESEAHYFIQVAQPYLTQGYLRPCIDVERGAGTLDPAGLSSWVDIWIHTVLSETGVEPIIYTNSDYAKNYLDASLKDHDLWIADWDNTLDTVPDDGAWDTWAFWQYGGDYGSSGLKGATIPGIAAAVDVDVHNGDETRLREFLVSGSTSPETTDLAWSTYLGGSDYDDADGVAVDSSGNVFVTGRTFSSGWASGGYDTTYHSGCDAFVAKLSPSGDLLWSTYLGGDATEGHAVVVDTSGNVFVMGQGSDPFVVKLSPSGELVWSTYLGGSDHDDAFGITVDPSGNIFVTGMTYSSDWVSGGYDTTYHGTCDAFVAKLGPLGEPIWSTYLGGNGWDGAFGIAVDASGDVVVTGSTSSSGWVSGGYDTTFNDVPYPDIDYDYDAFVVKLSGSGEHLWSTYLGGSATDSGLGIAMDASGNVLVTGRTYSSGWAVSGYDTTLDGNGDAFVVKLDPSGDLVWSTYLGGSSGDQGYGIAVDGSGNVVVAGMTLSPDWISGGYDTTSNGDWDAFVAKLSGSGGHLWSTYVGGSDYDDAYGVAVDGSGSILVVGRTGSSGWVSGGYDTTYNGGSDAFVVKLSVSGQTDQPVYFADANLKAAVEQALVVSNPTPADMLLLTSLNVLLKGITSLAGLEYATNLQVLDLYFNQISDISPLSGLTKLTVLHLTGNQISDISALSGLTNLTSLDLYYNQISDISPLSGLTKLTSLDLYYNQISDISPLSGLTKLTVLYLTHNQISDISALSGLTNLTGLDLSINQISDISPLSGLTDLTWLAFWNNGISDISALSGLTNLTTLLLDGNPISDISALSGLTNLTYLELSWSPISDISALSGLTNLTRLWLYSNQISDISALSGLTNLTELRLHSNEISDISALSRLTNLTILELGGNQISGISALSRLTNLTGLDLGGNQISDVSPLSPLTNLRALYLDDNQISDISPLSGLTNQTWLSLRSNPLNSEAYSTYIPQLIQRGVDVYYDPPTEGDDDGVTNAVEQGPAGDDPAYDGNADGIPDWQQSNVASFDTVTGQYVTLACGEGDSLYNVQSTDNPSPVDSPVSMQAPYGFFDFEVQGITPGGSVVVEIYVPDGSLVNSYYKYGPTPDNATPHWYEFTYDGQTGAQVNGNVITLHFVDGLRGDEDITANGVIVEPGAPVWVPAPPTANDDTETVQEDSGPTTIDVLSNDTYLPDPPETLTITDKTNGSKGGVVEIIEAGARLTYTPNPDFFGEDSFTYTITDEDGLTDTATVTVTVDPINDAPMNTVPGPQTVDEDTNLVFSTANANAILVSDIDAGSNPVEVTLAATNGVLTLSGTAGLTFSVGDGTADATMTFTAAITNINAVLDGMFFSPTANYNGPASVQITTNDQGNTGAGGALSDTDTVDITVYPVNDAPTLTTVNTLTGATKDFQYVITYDMLAAAANEADVDGDVVRFRIESINGGTKKITKGGVDVAIGKPEAILGPGESWVWYPAVGKTGLLNAFTIKAWDGSLASATAVQVKVQVDLVPDLQPTAVDSSIWQSAEPGNPVDWMVTVKNNGPGPQWADWTVQWYLSSDKSFQTSDTLIGSQTCHETIAKGASVSKTYNAPVPAVATAGQKYLIARVVNTGPDGKTNNDTKVAADSDWFGPVAADADEANNAFETAKDLGYVTNTWSQNSKTLDSLSDVDWYSFTTLSTADSCRKVRIDFTNSEGDLALGLYRADGTLVAQVDGTGNTEQISLLGLLKGTYYIKVWSNRGDVSRNYKLTIMAPATPPPVSVNHLVSVSVGTMYVDRRTGQTSYEVAITNTSQTTILGPVRLVISQISEPSVSLANSNGKTVDGKPYLNLTDRLEESRLDPGETVTLRVFFNNPQRKRFEFQLLVLGVIPPP